MFDFYKVLRKEKMLNKIIFLYLILLWKIIKKKSNIIKNIKKLIFFKLFNFYIDELNK